MRKIKTFGCELEADEKFCQQWTKRQVRSIWGDPQQQPIREHRKDKMMPVSPPPNIGYSTRPINFNAPSKPEPDRTIKFRYYRDRKKEAS